MYLLFQCRRISGWCRGGCAPGARPSACRSRPHRAPHHTGRLHHARRHRVFRLASRTTLSGYFLKLLTTRNQLQKYLSEIVFNQKRNPAFIANHGALIGEFDICKKLPQSCVVFRHIHIVPHVFHRLLFLASMLHILKSLKM